MWPLVVSRFALDGGAMFGVVPRTLWERSFPVDDRGRIRLVSRLLAVRFEDSGHTAVIDAGMGLRWSERDAQRYDLDIGVPGPAEALAACGIRADDISHVVMTHLHFDHAGGWVVRADTGELRPIFARAKHFVQRAQWDWAINPSLRDQGSFVTDDFMPLDAAGLIERVDGSSELLPGLEVIALKGHTPGLQIPLIHGQQYTVAFFADLVPTAAHVGSAWIMAYDLFPLDTLAEKEQLLQRAADEKWIIILAHDPTVEAATVQKEQNCFVLEPCTCPISI